MSNDHGTSAPTRSIPLQGFVDAVEPECVYGWVWDPSAPAEKLEVEIWLDDAPLGTVCADRPRADLEKLGIGGGACAFEFSPVEPLTQDQRVRVVALARPASRAEPVALPRLGDEVDRVAALEQAIHRVTGALERIAARQEAALRMQKAALEALSERVDALRNTLQAETAKQRGRHELEDELQQRLSALEVIQARFDTALQKATARVGTEQAGSPRHPSGWLAVAAVVLALTAGGVLGYLLGSL